MRAFALLSLCAVLAVADGAEAEQFSYTDAQLLYGTRFDDWHYGYSTSNRRMTTVTLEHYGTWKYGDNYMFTDLTFGKFVDRSGVPTGNHAHSYTEWTTRIGLAKLAGVNGALFGPIKDVFAAGEINVGSDGFWAVLGGASFDLALPDHLVLGILLLARKDAFDRTTYQVTPFWELPFALGAAQLLFRGYVDVAGTDDLGVDVNSHPQFLLDLGAFAGAEGHLQAGCAWYLHFNAQIRSQVPQAILRWLF